MKSKGEIMKYFFIFIAMGILSFSGSSHAEGFSCRVTEVEKENKLLGSQRDWAEKAEVCSSKDTLSYAACLPKKREKKIDFSFINHLFVAEVETGSKGEYGLPIDVGFPKECKRQLKSFFNTQFSKNDQSDNERLEKLKSSRDFFQDSLRVAHDQFIIDEKLGQEATSLLKGAFNKISLANILKKNYNNERTEVLQNKDHLEYVNGNCGKNFQYSDLRNLTKEDINSAKKTLKEKKALLKKAKGINISKAKEEVSEAAYDLWRVAKNLETKTRITKKCNEKMKSKKLEELMIALIDNKEKISRLLKSDTTELKRKYRDYIKDVLGKSNKAEEAYAKEIYLQRQHEGISMTPNDSDHGDLNQKFGYTVSKNTEKFQDAKLFKKCEVLVRSAGNRKKHSLAYEYRTRDDDYKKQLWACKQEAVATCSQKPSEKSEYGRAYTFEEKKQAYVKLKDVCSKLGNLSSCIPDVIACTENVNGSSSSGKKGSSQNSKGER